MEDINWLKIVDKIVEVKGKQKPIHFNGQYFNYAIFKNNNSNIGFMIIWNTSSFRAVNISRMKISNDLEFLPMDEEKYHNIVPSNLNSNKYFLKYFLTNKLLTQFEKEFRIRSIGTTYIRDKATRELLDITNIPTRLSRRE